MQVIISGLQVCDEKWIPTNLWISMWDLYVRATQKKFILAFAAVTEANMNVCDQRNAIAEQDNLVGHLEEDWHSSITPVFLYSSIHIFFIIFYLFLSV